MIIVTCVKQVVDTRTFLEVGEQGRIMQREPWPILRIDPCSRAALEQAMKIKEGVKCEVIAVTIGSVGMETALRFCIARGVDHAVHIVDDSLTSLDSYIASLVLSRFILKMDYQMVLCGEYSTDENAHFFGPALAESLGLPHVTGAIRIEISCNGKMASVWRKLERGDRELVECPLPTVIGVEPSGLEPAYVSANHYKAAFCRDIQRLELNQLVALDGINSPTPTVRFSPPRPRPKKIPVLNSTLSPMERMRRLMTGGVTERKAKFIKGDPMKAAFQLIQLLKEEHTIPWEPTWKKK